MHFHTPNVTLTHKKRVKKRKKNIKSHHRHHCRGSTQLNNQLIVTFSQTLKNETFLDIVIRFDERKICFFFDETQVLFGF